LRARKVCLALCTERKNCPGDESEQEVAHEQGEMAVPISLELSLPLWLISALLRGSGRVACRHYCFESKGGLEYYGMASSSALFGWLPKTRL